MSERYQIKAKIGQGGIGAVYRAFDTHLQREVALKRLLPPDESESFDDDPTKSLFKEAHLLSALQHPNVVSVYDVGTDADGMFVVMELVDGETFDQVVDRGLLTEDDFAEMVAQTLEALIAAQDKALVHRDIKPTNLMVKWLPSGKFQFKLLDFGLAKFSPKPSQQTIGLNDAILGSIHFMAPEQFERLPLDGRTDLYAIGCMYYYGLTGRYPFDGDSAAEVMAAHLSHRFAPMLEIRPDLSKRTSDWVLWLMNRDMNQRPASAQEALEVFFNAEIPVPGVQTAPRLILPNAGGLAPRLAGPANPAVPTMPTNRPVTGSIRSGSGPVRPGAATSRLGSSPVRISSGAVRLGTGVVRPGTGPTAVAPTTATSTIPGDDVPPQYGAPQSIAQKPLFKRWPVIAGIVAGVLVLGLGIFFMTRGKGKSNFDGVVEYLNQEQNMVGNAEWVNTLVPYLDPPGDTPGRDEIVRKTQTKLARMKGNGVDAALLGHLANSKGKVQEQVLAVVSKRGMAEAMGTLSKIAQDGAPDVAHQAIEAMSQLGTARDSGTIMSIMLGTKDTSLRRKCELVMEILMEKSTDKAPFLESLQLGLAPGASKECQQASLRLLGKSGVPAASDALAKAVNSSNGELRLAAISALRDWPDDSQIDRLSSMAEGSVDESIRNAAFDALIGTLSMSQERVRPLAKHEAWWNKAESLANTSQRKETLLKGLAKVTDRFSTDIASRLENDADVVVKKLAAKTAQDIKALRKQKGTP